MVLRSLKISLKTRTFEAGLVMSSGLVRTPEDSGNLRDSFRPEGSSDEISMSKSPRNTHDRSYIALCIDSNLED